MSNLETVIRACGIHPALGAEAAGWWIEQSAYELAAFIDAITPLGIKTVLEVGTGHKMGLARFMSEILGWCVVSVDIHQPQYVALLVDLRVSETRLDFPDMTFDLVIIDADHRYESIKADYEHYGKYATKVMMFHDIAGLRDCEGAAKFWEEIALRWGADKPVELKPGYSSVFDPDRQACCGIGWLDVQAVNAAPPIEIDAPADPPQPKKKPGRKSKVKNA